MPSADPETRQFRAFRTNIEYSRQLINAGDSLVGLQPGALDIGDLYRAAWVQAVSAIDHWLHEELFRRITDLLTGTAIPLALQRLELPVSTIEEIQLGNLTLADAVLERTKAEWASKPLHNPNQISKAYRLATDTDLWAGAAEQLNQWNHGRTTLNATRVKQRFSDITKRRHQIAHDADLLDGDLKQRRPIDSAQATDAVDWLERIARAFAAALG